MKRVKVEAKESYGEESIKSERQQLLGEGGRVRMGFEWTHYTHVGKRNTCTTTLFFCFLGSFGFELRVNSTLTTLWMLQYALQAKRQLVLLR